MQVNIFRRAVSRTDESLTSAPAKCAQENKTGSQPILCQMNGKSPPEAETELGGKRVVVATFTLALAAKHERSGQQKERGGH